MLRLAWCLAFGAALCVASRTAHAEPTPPAGKPKAVIGAEDNAAPWSYADGTGYVNDVVRAALARSGWQVEFKVMPYARCKALVTSGKLLACFSASKTPELEAQLLYPKRPVFEASNQLVARADAAFSGCDAALWPKPLHVGRVVGYEYRSVVDALFRSGEMVPDDALSEAISLRKLQAGRIDAALITVDAVKRLEYVAALAHASGAFKTVCDFGGEAAYIVFSRRHAASMQALKAFDEGFEALHKEGRITAMQHAWRARLTERISQTRVH